MLDGQSEAANKKQSEFDSKGKKSSKSGIILLF
jgi:hypothetical protein